jgi:2-polyprenyl-3-methyl-5-hydroxy-6-metoxy-1,4-benzoquinol methylase
MEFTGERFVPGPDSDLLGAEHLQRYLFASRYAKDKSVLDIACGSGYGSNLLHEAGAATVTGVDVSSEAVEFAVARHGNEKVKFLIANAEGFRDGSYDLIVSFETLEHLDNRRMFLSNVSAMLKEDGILIISTPNKAVTSPMRPPEKIRNKFHKYEYVEKEFVHALEDAGFRNIRKFGQHSYPSLFTVQIISRLFRRWVRDTVETATVLPMSPGRIPRYFVFIAGK